MRVNDSGYVGAQAEPEHLGCVGALAGSKEFFGTLRG